MDILIVPQAEASVATLMKSIDRVIINPIIFFLFAVALVYFLYGLAQYLLSPNSEEVRKKSKSQMIWGTIGLFIMVAVFGIMRIIITTFGITNVVVGENGDYTIKNIDTGSATYTQGPNKVTYSLVGNSLGTWDAAANSTSDGKSLVSGQGTKDSYYTVSVAGTTSLDGTDSWDVGDTAYYDGKKWIKKTLSTPIQTATHPLTYAEPPAELLAKPIKPIDGLSYQTTSLCWEESLYTTSTTEYGATSALKALALSHYTDYAKKPYMTGGVVFNAKIDPKYPIVLSSNIFYSKDNQLFYAWEGAVGPIGNGHMSDCNPAQVADPLTFEGTDSLFVSQQISAPSTYATPDKGKTYTDLPFTNEEYKSTDLCWEEALYGKASSEYDATQAVKALATSDYKAYAFAHGGVGQQSNSINVVPYPITVSNIIFYDKVNNLYYNWWGAVGPVGTGTINDCQWILKPVKTLPMRSGESTKNSTLVGKYKSDATYLRVLDSGASPVLNTARTIAITNALIQIAQLNSLVSIDNIKYKILAERYFPTDPDTGNIDYFVVLQAPRL